MQLNTENINAYDNILYKVITEKEAMPYNIRLSDKISCGKYGILISDGTKSENYVFFKPDRTEISVLLSELESKFKNKADFVSLLSGKTAVFGKDGTNGAKIAEGVYYSVKNTGCNEENLLRAFAACEGFTECLDEKISFAAFIDEYSPYISGETVSAYGAMGEKAAASTGNFIKYADYESSGGDKAAENVIFLSKASNTADYAALRSICTEYFKKHGISMDKYNAINGTFYKDNVWLGMMNGNIMDVNSVVQLFNRNTEEQAKKAASDLSGNKPGGSGGTGGGNGTSSGSKVTFGAAFDSTSGNAEKTVFSDIDGHWAKEDIESLCALGIVNGFEDGTFRPNGNITRAEFVKMLTTVLKLSPEITAEFEDVGSETWFAGYVGAAYKKGLINGIGDRVFAPYGNITRQDAAVIVYRAAEKPDAQNSADYADAAMIADYAQDAVNVLNAYGLMKGSEEKFRPLSEITRAEAAVLLLRTRTFLSQGADK